MKNKFFSNSCNSQKMKIDIACTTHELIREINSRTKNDNPRRPNALLTSYSLSKLAEIGSEYLLHLYQLEGVNYDSAETEAIIIATIKAFRRIYIARNGKKTI